MSDGTTFLTQLDDLVLPLVTKTRENGVGDGGNYCVLDHRQKMYCEHSVIDWRPHPPPPHPTHPKNNNTESVHISVTPPPIIVPFAT